MRSEASGARLGPNAHGGPRARNAAPAQAEASGERRAGTASGPSPPARSRPPVCHVWGVLGAGDGAAGLLRRPH